MDATLINLDADEGFAAKPVTADLARRQLHVSLGVMGVIVAAGVAIFSTFGLAPAQIAPEYRAEMTVQQPHFVRPMTASSVDEDARTGG